MNQLNFTALRQTDILDGTRVTLVWELLPIEPIDPGFSVPRDKKWDAAVVSLRPYPAHVLLEDLKF